ncbi:hypothetical protein BGX38DRAFT_1269158 [Terfezia claveryi]|nr:hypothetical protein BGX38DRAFT_1269158 [Terfezia claveryi]
MPQPTPGRVPLDNLLHAVFIHTANIFNDLRKHNPRATANTNSLIRVNIPTSIDRFQYALDLLEAEILRAKATLRRDLEVLRQRAEEAKVAAEQEGEENRAKGLKEERANQGQNEKETSEK